MKSLFYKVIVALLYAVTALGGPVAAHAQDADPQPMTKIGILNYSDSGPVDYIKELLAERGLVEGKNVAYNVLVSGRSAATAEENARALVAWKPDLIFSLMSNADLAMKDAVAGTDIPVIVWSTDPRSVGVVASNRKPGGNFTGFTYTPNQAFEHLRFLKLAVPNLQKVCYLYNHTYVVAPHELEDFKAAAKLMPTKVIVFEVLEKDKLAPAFAAMKKTGCGAVAIGPHELFNTNGDLVGGLARQYRFPTIGLQRTIVKGGGLASYSPPFQRGWAAMADVAMRILKGEKPADIPVERGFKSPLTINMKTAAYLNLALSPQLIDEADTLIE